jgi:hypothetical protein
MGVLTILEIDVRAQVHLSSDRLEDQPPLPPRRPGEFDLPVQSTGTQERRVKRVLSVGRHDHLYRVGA